MVLLSEKLISDPNESIDTTKKSFFSSPNKVFALVAFSLGTFLVVHYFFDITKQIQLKN